MNKMNMKIASRPVFFAALFAAAFSACAGSVPKDANPAPGGAAEKKETKVDFDFTRMNPTMSTAHIYRLAANPKEFAGKTLRVSGIFVTGLDNQNGKRYFGCIMDVPAGCSCCTPGGLLEFAPKDSYVWPAGFPPAESRITVTGRLKAPETGSADEFSTIPRLVDADMSWNRGRASP